MKDISRIRGVNWLKIVYLFNSWQQADYKYSSLSIASGRGAKIKLDSIKELLPDLVVKHARDPIPVLEEFHSKYYIQMQYIIDYEINKFIFKNINKNISINILNNLVDRQ